MKRYLVILMSVIILLVSVQVQANELSAQKLLKEVVKELDQVHDFKGRVISKIYLKDKVVNYQTQIMKSKTRLMTQNSNQVQITDQTKGKLLNSIPWVYLPPNYDVLKNSMPLKGQLDYQQPLQNLYQIYDLELLGEALDQGREVYIVQLENLFSTQRIFIDKEWKAISKIKIFNGANIKAATINYDDFKLFNPKIWLPTKIEVKDSRNQKIMETIYQDWKINIGLTDFDFAQGFETDYRNKIKQLKKKLTNRSQDDTLYWLISDLYQENGNLEEAIINLQEAIRLKDKIKYRKRLAHIYQLQGKYKQALAEVKAALQIDYNNSSLHYLLGEIQLQSGNINQARYSLEKAVDFSSKNTTYLEKLFWVYSSLTEDSGSYMLERAERIIKKLVHLDPKNKSYRIYLGDIYFDKGELIKAAQSYNKAIELAPEDTWAYIKLAKFYEKTDKDNKAEELYRYIFYLDDSLENQQRLAQFYFEQKKYKLALKEYKAINERTTGGIGFKLKLAEAYLAVGQNEKGLNIFRQILEDENTGQIYLEIGEIVRKYNLDAAINIYHKVLKSKGLLTNEQKEKIYHRLGYIYFEEESKKEFNKLNKLLEINSQAKIYQILGEYKFEFGDLDKAVSYFKLAVEKQSNATNHYNLALVYLLIDQFELARKEAKHLIKLNARSKGKKLFKLVERLEKLTKKHKNNYQPGRINCLKANKLRQQGRLNQALIKYKKAISENHNYRLPYFYVGVISAIQQNYLDLELAKVGLQNEELQLLEDLIVEIEVINQF